MESRIVRTPVLDVACEISGALDAPASAAFAQAILDLAP